VAAAAKNKSAYSRHHTRFTPHGATF